MTECHSLGVNCVQPCRTEALDPGVDRCPPEGCTLLGLGMVVLSLWSSILLGSVSQSLTRTVILLTSQTTNYTVT